MKKKKIRLLLIFLFLSTLPHISVVNTEESKKIVYLGDINCTLCHEKVEIFESFLEEYSDVDSELYMLDFSDSDDIEFIEEQLEKYEIDSPPVPLVILIDGSDIEVLYNEDINYENLEFWYNYGYVLTDEQKLNLWVSFISGIIIGASPCVLLILGIFGTSLSLNQSKKKYNSIMIGFIIGLLLAYIIISALFLYAMQSIGFIQYFKYIFGTILLIIGLWQILDYKNEKSKIFGTPQKVKDFLKEKFTHNTLQAAFVIGFIFAFIKLPCFGGSYLMILYKVQNDPTLWSYIIFYLLGMVLPIIITFIILKKGINRGKIDGFRLKYKPHLRVLSGLFIITITMNLLFEEQGFSINYLMISLIIEILVISILIYLKSNKEKSDNLDKEEVNNEINNSESLEQ